MKEVSASLTHGAGLVRGSLRIASRVASFQGDPTARKYPVGASFMTPSLPYFSSYQKLTSCSADFQRGDGTYVASFTSLTPNTLSWPVEIGAFGFGASTWKPSPRVISGMAPNRMSGLKPQYTQLPSPIASAASRMFWICMP